MAEARVVVGGTPAALVAADALGRAGVPVRLLTPTAGVGRGFAPLRQDDRELALGVRLLELSYEGDTAPPPLGAYVPGNDGHRSYVRLIRSWVEELVGEALRPVAPPRVVVDGRLVGDYLFTVELGPLARATGGQERAQIAREATAARVRHGDAGALERPLVDLTLESASRISHGETFHRRFIEPLAEKLVDGGSATILAEWRRKAWLPLFWPRTVAEAFGGAVPTFEPRRTFEEVAPGGIGRLLDALLERIRANRRIDVRPVERLVAVVPHGESLRLAFADGHVEEAIRPALGVPIAELHSAMGIEVEVDRMRTVLAWVEGPEEMLAPGLDLVHVLDADNPVARISSGSRTPVLGHRVLCVELRHDVGAATIGASAIRGLSAAGLLKGDAAVTIKEGAMSSLVVPSAITRARLSAACDELAERLDGHLLGAALAPGADSLNEQIVQGLAVAEALR